MVILRTASWKVYLGTKYEIFWNIYFCEYGKEYGLKQVGYSYI